MLVAPKVAHLLRLRGSRFALRATSPLSVHHGNQRRHMSKNDVKGKELEDALSKMECDKLYGQVASHTKELGDFATMLEKGRLHLFPDYQRSYVWKPEKASRLLVTVLCSRFMPPIVLHEKRKGQFDVVDGKQRLTTLLGFLLNQQGAVLPRAVGVRKKIEAILPGLKVLSKLDESYVELEGLSFDDLSEDRRNAFESYPISYQVIPFGTEKKDIFEVYEGK